MEAEQRWICAGEEETIFSLFLFLGSCPPGRAVSADRRCRPAVQTGSADRQCRQPALPNIVRECLSGALRPTSEAKDLGELLRKEANGFLEEAERMGSPSRSFSQAFFWRKIAFLQ